MNKNYNRSVAYPIFTFRWLAIHGLAVPTVFFLGSITAMQFMNLKDRILNIVLIHADQKVTKQKERRINNENTNYQKEWKNHLQNKPNLFIIKTLIYGRYKSTYSSLVNCTCRWCCSIQCSCSFRIRIIFWVRFIIINVKNK